MTTTTFAKALGEAVAASEWTRASLSQKLGKSPNYLSGAINRDAVSPTVYRRILRYLPQLKTAPKPSSMKEKPGTGKSPMVKKRGKRTQFLIDREKIGLSRSELAEQIGISSRYLLRIEKGEVTPQGPTLDKLETALTNALDGEARTKRMREQTYVESLNLSTAATMGKMVAAITRIRLSHPKELHELLLGAKHFKMTVADLLEATQ